jgi:hypothetical protein
MLDGISLTEGCKQGGQSRQLAAQGAASEFTPLEVLAPGQDVRAADQAELLRPGDPNEAHELLQVFAVSAPGIGIVDVGEPLGRRRHLGELVEFRRGQRARDRRRRHQIVGAVELSHTSAPRCGWNTGLSRRGSERAVRVHACTHSAARVRIPLSVGRTSNRRQVMQLSIMTTAGVLHFPQPDPIAIQFGGDGGFEPIGRPRRSRTGWPEGTPR